MIIKLCVCKCRRKEGTRTFVWLCVCVPVHMQVYVSGISCAHKYMVVRRQASSLVTVCLIVLRQDLVVCLNCIARNS